MVTVNRHIITGSRLVAVIVLLVLAAFASGCVQTKRLDIGAGEISGRPVAALNNPAKPMYIGTNSEPGLLDVVLKSATGTYKKAAQVAQPSLDPAQIVEEQLLASLAARYHTMPSARLNLPMKPFKNNKSWPNKERIAAIMTGAKSQGFDGLVLDVVPGTYEALTHGHGLAIGGARVVFSYSVLVAVVDAASGELLASGFCVGPGGSNPKLKTVLAGGQHFVDERVRKIADKCAADISRKILRRN